MRKRYFYEGQEMIPTSTNVKVDLKSATPANTGAVVVFMPQEKRASAPDPLGKEESAAVGRLSASGAFTGKAKEVGLEIIELAKGKFRRVYVIGLGKSEKITSETIRQSAGAALRALRTHRVQRGAFIVPPALKSLSSGDIAEALVVGAMLAAFDYEEYQGTGKKTEDDEKPVALELSIVSQDKRVGEAVTRGRLLADGQNFTRTIASRPGNNISPPTLAKVAQAMAREVGLTCRVLDEKVMAKLGMGGILAVGAGSSATPPRMIVLEFDGRGKKTKRSDGPLLIVGKAITFDTGGISIKPADRMGKMIYDKSGGTVVLGLMYALAKLKIAAHVVGILSSAENAISERAYRPGDILRMYNGVTVEVTNTDAEGRLVLSDALAWGIATYKPQAVVDLATLTGGVVTALGTTMAGVMGNNDKLIADLTSAGEFAGEKIWRLPLGPDQRDQIKSHHADIVNSAGREASPLQGAAFLSYFVPTDGSVPWAHLDIAGVADSDKELPYYSKGSTGWGVRTLVEWIRRRSAGT
jgi:leucyl aminopeptidase